MFDFELVPAPAGYDGPKVSVGFVTLRKRSENLQAAWHRQYPNEPLPSVLHGVITEVTESPSQFRAKLDALFSEIENAPPSSDARTSEE